MSINAETFNHINSFVDQELAERLNTILNEAGAGRPAGHITSTLLYLAAAHIFSNSLGEDDGCQVSRDYGSYLHHCVHAFYEQHPELHPDSPSDQRH